MPELERFKIVPPEIVNPPQGLFVIDPANVVVAPPLIVKVPVPKITEESEDTEARLKIVLLKPFRSKIASLDSV